MQARSAPPAMTWTLLLLVLAMLGPLGEAARNRGRMHASEGCEFPSKWTGTWFQKGVHPPIKIEKDIFSLKGKCLSKDNPMFFIEDPKEKCFRCVVIYEKHPNVLQYRETFCDNYRSLPHACSTINADAPLYSLFRVDATPVSCQLRGPFTFTYSRGHGECQYPVSTIDTCADDSHLLFRFQACADVLGTESSVEELSCLAVWKEGSAHYLVGKMSNEKNHNLPFTDDNTYRCFVFDYFPEKGTIQMSQSADATCDGVVSPLEGSRTMTLHKSKHPASGCQFPGWATSAHKWHTLDGVQSYVFHHRNTSFRLPHPAHEHLDTRFTCTEAVDDTPDASTFVAYSMSGCKNGFVCTKFYRRHKHIIEIQFGDFARSKHEACHSAFSEAHGREYTTLVAASASQASCPRLVATDGLRVHATRAELCRDASARVVGCRSRDAIEFLTSCPAFTDFKSFHCHGDWEENGRSYLVTGLRNTKNKYCFVYWSNDQTTHLSGIHDTCRRTVEPGITGNFTFNISSAGLCDSLLSSNTSNEGSPRSPSAILLLAALLLRLLVR